MPSKTNTGHKNCHFEGNAAHKTHELIFGLFFSNTTIINPKGINLKLIHWYKNFAFLSAILWAGLGLLTVASVTLSTIGWEVNVMVGVLFISIGVFLYLRAKNLHWFYDVISTDVKNTPQLNRFLRLEMIFVLGTCFLGGLLLMAGISRVFGEGYAIFG